MATDNPSEDMIMDEIIRSKVRKFVDEPPPKTRSERFYAHPLAAATITFIFTALFAGAVGYYFNLKQKAFEESLARERQEMDHRHQEQQSEFQRAREDAKAESDHREKQIEDQVSFARDLQKNYFGQAGTLTLEMSKTKVDKLAEVWGHLSRYEGALRELLELKVMALRITVSYMNPWRMLPNVRLRVRQMRSWLLIVKNCRLGKQTTRNYAVQPRLQSMRLLSSRLQEGSN